ncbi:MAG: hypothetical protein LLF94_05280, partial [Chlamydiales bacterium]|nr:hypothetical protein [Chlamydiales bacterium]
MFVIPGGPSSSSFYMAFGEQFSIGKKRVCITTVKDKEINEYYPLKMPILPVEMPWESALYSDKAVEWFLYKGFVPVLIDNKTKVTLIDENSYEQNLHITALSSKVDQITRSLGVFLQHKKQGKLKDPALQNDEVFQDWYLLLSDKNEFEFTSRIELLYDLVEECKKSLKCENFVLAEQCLERLCLITDGSFLFKDCHADLLRFQNAPKAADIYLDISGSKMGEVSFLYLEKAIRSNPANPRVSSAIVQAQCSQARALHCYVTAYLACGCTPKAVDYLKIIKQLGEGANNPICTLLEATSKSQSVRKKERRVQVPVQWLAASESAIPPLPSVKSPRLGKSRGSTDKVQVVSEDALSKSQATIRRVKQVSGTILKNELKAGYTHQGLEKLLWWYIEKQKWAKAEYIAKKLLQDGYKFTIEKSLADIWQKQGRVPEAVRKYYRLAKTEYKAGNVDAAKECLESLYAANSNLGAFTHQEKQVLYLLFLELFGQS